MEREFKHEVLDLLWDETESLATHDEDERLKAAEQRLIATASQVNIAEQRLKDTQSQGTLNSKQENINTILRD